MPSSRSRPPTARTASTSGSTSATPRVRACPGHLHVHCLPRWHGDTNFMTAVAETRVLPESLDEQLAQAHRGLADPGTPTPSELSCKVRHIWRFLQQRTGRSAGSVVVMAERRAPRRAPRRARRLVVRRAVPVPRQQPAPHPGLPLPRRRGRVLPAVARLPRRRRARERRLPVRRDLPGARRRVLHHVRMAPRRRREGRARRVVKGGRVSRRSRVGAARLARSAQPADVAHPPVLGRGTSEATRLRARRRRRRPHRRPLHGRQPRGLDRGATTQA